MSDSSATATPGNGIAATTVREHLVMPLWALTVFLVVMNTTMFNVALPSVSGEFHLTASASSWIVTGYSIVFAIATITFSRLTDFVPIRRLLLIGVSLFFAASMVGVFAHNFYLLMAARLLQAAGAACAPGVSAVFAARYIPIERRGKSMSMISSAASLGFGLGPVIGGAVTETLGWNFLFAVSACVLMLLPLFLKWLPREQAQPLRFDILGGLLLGAGVTCALLFLTTFHWGWLVGSVLSLALCWRRINRFDPPFVQPRLLKNGPYLRIIFMCFAAFFTHFASLFVMPILLAKLFDKNAAEIGLMIFPGAMLSAVAARYIGRMIDRFGNAPLMRVGHLLLLLSTVLLATTSSLSPYMVLVSYLFMSVGFSTTTSALTNEISRRLPKDDIGTGMGMAQLIQFFGGAFGVSVCGLLLATGLEYRMAFWLLTGLLTASFVMFLRYRKYSRSL